MPKPLRLTDHSLCAVVIAVAIALAGCSPGQARAATDCAIAGVQSGSTVPHLMFDTVAGTLPEASSWTAVFIGSVLHLGEEQDGYRTAILEVETAFKGDIGETVGVRYPQVDEEDGFTLAPGNRYFVAATGPNADGILTTSRCTSTQPISGGSAATPIDGRVPLGGILPALLIIAAVLVGVGVVGWLAFRRPRSAAVQHE